MKYFVSSRSTLIRFTIVVACLCVAIGCTKRTDEVAIQSILAEIGELQTKEEVFAREVASRAGAFTADKLVSFPENRADLAGIAEQQIDSLNSMATLKEQQIVKLAGANSITQDRNYLQYIDLTKQEFEKYLSLNRLSVERYKLFGDPRVLSKELLDEKLSEMKSKQSQIDLEIAELDAKKVEFRKQIGK